MDAVPSRCERFRRHIRGPPEPGQPRPSWLELQLARKIMLVCEPEVRRVHQLVEYDPFYPGPLTVHDALHVFVLLKLRDQLVPCLELRVEDLLRRPEIGRAHV